MALSQYGLKAKRIEKKMRFQMYPNVDVSMILNRTQLSENCECVGICFIIHHPIIINLVTLKSISTPLPTNVEASCL